MTRRFLPALAASFMVVSGCGQQSVDGPPAVRIGDSVCDQCNMIISNEQFATATVVVGPRGPEARLFDDFNCQVNYETEHPDIEVHSRWSHGYASIAWFKTETGHFLMSEGLRTPMGSNTAAFETREAAVEAQQQHGGDVMTFEDAWERLSP